MRFVRHGKPGAEKPGLLDAAGGLRDLSGAIGDIDATVLSEQGLDRLRRLAPENLPPVDADARLGAPLARIGKVIGVGLNYRDHAEEVRLPLPKEPTLFLKATSAVCGPTDDLVIPLDARSLDWEVELGIVIGTAGVYIAQSAAARHIAGYCVGIDFSEREFQFNRGGQGFKGKSADTFGPLGPWLVTADEVPDPHALGLGLDVNGVRRQHGSTREMIFSVTELVAYISRFMSLQPGDVILTGTPAGVGHGRDPKTYLQPGDLVTATIDNLGAQSHRVVPFAR